jgi:hypothetical protein
VAATALAQFSVVFDAIYTPLETQLLKVGIELTTQLQSRVAYKARPSVCLHQHTR